MWRAPLRRGPSSRWRLVRAVVLSAAFLLILDAIAFVLFFFLVAPAIWG